MPALILVVGLKELHLDASVENFAYELIRLYAVTGNRTGRRCIVARHSVRCGYAHLRKTYVNRYRLGKHPVGIEMTV